MSDRLMQISLDVLGELQKLNQQLEWLRQDIGQYMGQTTMDRTPSSMPVSEAPEVVPHVTPAASAMPATSTTPPLTVPASSSLSPVPVPFPDPHGAARPLVPGRPVDPRDPRPGDAPGKPQDTPGRPGKYYPGQGSKGGPGKRR